VYEVLAVALGVAIGLAFRGVSTRRALPLIICLGLAAGAAVSALAGEIEVSLAFPAFDTIQTTGAALLTYALARVAAPRAAGGSSGPPSSPWD
jgi:hypothetical protein